MKNFSKIFKGLAVFGVTAILLLHTFSTKAQITVETEDATCEGKADGKAKIKLTTSLGGTFRYSVDGSSFQSSPEFNELKSGDYSAVVRNEESKCEFSKEFTIKAPQDFSVEISSNGDLNQSYSMCGNAPEITLTAQVNEGEAPFKYSWGKSSLKVSATGSYSIDVTDARGCIAQDAAYVLFIGVICSSDPNDIIGPKGVGPKKWVSKNEKLDYTIRFENDPKFATAPAQVVKVNQKLDPHLNIYSLRLKSFGFGNMTFNVPENRSNYSQRYDLVKTLGVFVDVIAGIDVQKKEAFWVFTSIDPVTGIQPSNPNHGLLPVNDSTHIGEGFVSYSIVSAEKTLTGDSIHAKANIVFDINEEILTPEIFNIIDALAPSSEASGKSETLLLGDSLNFSIKGRDDLNGSGLKDYNIYFKKDGGKLTLIRENIPKDSSLFFKPETGNYCIYSTARDSVNNKELLNEKADLCFIVKKPGQISLKDPVNTKELCTGYKLPIAWSSKDISDVNIYFKSGQSAYQSLAKNISAVDSMYNWTLPDTLSENTAYTLKIEDASEKNTYSERTDYFSVRRSKSAKIFSSTENKLCLGRSTSLKAENEFVIYQWSTGDKTRSIDVVLPGTYTLTGKDAQGCSRVDSIQLYPELTPAKPVLKVKGSLKICTGDSLILRAPLGYASYKWSSGDSLSTLVVKSTGHYFVSVGNANICRSPWSDSIYVAVNDKPLKPEIKIAGNLTFCEEDSLILTGPKGYKIYNWSNGENGQKIFIKKTLDVLLTVIDSNECEAVSDTLKTTVNQRPAKPYIAEIRSSRCTGDTVILWGPPGYNSYNWSNGESSDRFSTLESGTYFLSVTDEKGCTSSLSDTAFINFNPRPPKPVISYESSFLCESDSIKLTAPKSELYKWSNGDFKRSTYVYTSGNYTLSIADTSGCFSLPSDTLKLTKFNVDAGKDTTVYKGFSLVSCVNLEAKISGGLSPVEFMWDNGATTQSTKICPDVAGTYIVTAKSADGCIATDTVQVCIEDIGCTAFDDQPSVEVCDQRDSIFETHCVKAEQVPALLKNGFVLGSCEKLNPCSTIVIPLDFTKSKMVKAASSASPNPFVNSTTINFKMPEDNFVVLKVYDMSGVEIAKLFEGDVKSGKEYSINFSPAKDLPSGVYIYKILSEGGSLLIDKLILTR